jgi:hypothetical protein
MSAKSIRITAYYGDFRGIIGTPEGPMPEDAIVCTSNAGENECNDSGARLLVTGHNTAGIWRGTNGPARGTYEAAPSVVSLTLKENDKIVNAGEVQLSYAEREEKTCSGTTQNYAFAEAFFNSD